MFKRQRPKRRQSRYLKKRRLKFLRIVLVLCVFLICFIGTGSRFLRANSVVVGNISIDGNSTIKASKIKNFATNELAGAYMAIFPKKSIFIFPEEEIEKNIKENIKRVKSVDISRNGFSSIKIILSERKPYALWCGQDEENKINEEGKNKKVEEGEKKEKAREVEGEKKEKENECFFIDKRGIIFSKAPFFTEDVYIRYYTNTLDDNLKNRLGKTIFEDGTFEKVKKFLSLLKQTDLEIKKVFEHKEGDFSILLESQCSVLFSSKQDIDEAFLNLKSALDSQPLLSTDIKDIEYIDVRFSEKVFYKIRK